MTTEQKAKAYDEALERAKKLLLGNEHSNTIRSYFEHIFPELRESEDEIHRRWILEYLYDGLLKADEQFKDHFKSAIDWLEKQKEPTKEELYAEAGTTENEYIANTMKMVRAMREKQKEQKPAECIEDSVKFEEGFKAGRESGLRDGQKYVLNNLDSYGLCKPAEWGEDDERMLKWIEDILLIAGDDLNDKLNGKVSPITDSAYSSMKLCIAKCLSWLKSLRPDSYKNCNSRWKPSEGQMKALQNAVALTACDKELARLYNQLKKL